MCECTVSEAGRCFIFPTPLPSSLALASMPQSGGVRAWDENWEKVYGLADIIVERIFVSAGAEPTPARSRL